MHTRNVLPYFILSWNRIKCLGEPLFAGRQPRTISRGRIRFEKSGYSISIAREFDYETTRTAKFPMSSVSNRLVFLFGRGDRTIYCWLSRHETEKNLFRDAVVLSKSLPDSIRHRLSNSILSVLNLRIATSKRTTRNKWPFLACRNDQRSNGQSDRFIRNFLSLCIASIFVYIAPLYTSQWFIIFTCN